MLANYFIHAPKILFDFFFDLIYFLPWWYSRGLRQAVQKAWFFVVRKENELAILIWIKNIGKPLVNDYNWKGTLKSIFKRLAQIILRLMIFLFWSAVSAVGIILYLTLPILIIWQIIFQAL